MVGSLIELMKTGRNESCPCGSGKKYKKCCMVNDNKLIEKKYSEYLELKSKHLLKEPVFFDELRTLQEIIDAYDLLGYVVDVETTKYEKDELLGDAEFLTVNLICPHGFSEHGMGYEMEDGMWVGYERAGGSICSVCEFIRKHKSIPCCPKCGTAISVLPKEERLNFYKKGLDYFSDTYCPKCGSVWVECKQARA